MTTFYALIGLKEETSGERIVHLGASGGSILVHDSTDVAPNLGRTVPMSPQQPSS